MRWLRGSADLHGLAHITGRLVCRWSFLPGSGSELYRGVGAIVLGGLALSTALTLVVVPALFTLVWRVRLDR